MKHEEPSIKAHVAPYFKVELVDPRLPSRRVVNLLRSLVGLKPTSVVTTWKLCYDYNAIARIEELTGLDLLNIESWKEVGSKHFPVIVHCGLARYQPKITLPEVISKLDPVVQTPIQNTIIYMLFPGFREWVEKQAKEKDQGGPNRPNGRMETLQSLLKSLQKAGKNTMPSPATT